MMYDMYDMYITHESHLLLLQDVDAWRKLQYKFWIQNHGSREWVDSGSEDWSFTASKKKYMHAFEAWFVRENLHLNLSLKFPNHPKPPSLISLQVLLMTESASLSHMLSSIPAWLILFVLGIIVLADLA